MGSGLDFLFYVPAVRAVRLRTVFVIHDFTPDPDSRRCRIASSYIDDADRQFRFGNDRTMDDHGPHVVSWLTKVGKDWLLVKDSWSSSWNNDHPSTFAWATFPAGEVPG
jgi:hypothetical protein